MKKIFSLSLMTLLCSLIFTSCSKKLPNMDGYRMNDGNLIIKEEAKEVEDDKAIVDKIEVLNKLSYYYADYNYVRLTKPNIDVGNPPELHLNKPEIFKGDSISYNEILDFTSANVFEDAAHVEKILIKKGLSSKNISDEDYMKLVMYAYEYTNYYSFENMQIQGAAELIENNNTLEDMIKAIEQKFLEDINLDLDYEVENFTMKWNGSFFENYIDKDAKVPFAVIEN